MCSKKEEGGRREGGGRREKVGRERVSRLRRGQGTYNPKSAWMVVDSRRRVLPDIDGRLSSNWSSRSCHECF